ncbi:MAG: Na/Pi cotransporter family protein [Alphaproteobacteria bacterium]|nr:Na/Pi cotransporter family protein [Alphaproteobacteria bacterium]
MILAVIAAGLGLFFTGVKLIGSNLKQSSGRRLRAIISRGTRNRVAAAGVGVVAGAITQSTNAVTFIVVSMVSAGLIEARQAIPVVVWANVGTSVLVLLATLDMHSAILFLVAIAGLAHYLDLDRSARWRHVVGALLGLGLLFLGLDLLKQGAQPLRGLEITREFVAFSAQSHLIAVIIGTLLSLVAQSSATVSIIAVALVSSGILGIEQTILIIYGAGLGSGLSVWFLSSNLAGRQRQIANLQVACKAIGALILIPLIEIELKFGVPLVLALVRSVSADPVAQAAYVYLVLQVVSALAVTAFQGPLMAVLERASPPTREEELSRPRFIYELALDEPETALELAEREQSRLARFLIDMLDSIRAEEAGRTDRPDYLAVHLAGRTLAAEIDGFLAELMERGPGGHALERTTRVQTRNQVLLDLLDTVRDLVQAIDAGTVGPSLGPLTHAIVEALHTALTSMGEDGEAYDELGREVLLAMTGDRSAAMESVRRGLLENRQLGRAEQDLLFSLTSLFERGVWLIRRHVLLTVHNWA